MLAGYFYFLLAYYLALFSDSPIDSLVADLTIHTTQAKKSTYYAALFILLLQVFLCFLLNMSPNKGNESLYVTQFL